MDSKSRNIKCDFITAYIDNVLFNMSNYNTTFRIMKLKCCRWNSSLTNNGNGNEAEVEYCERFVYQWHFTY